MKSTRAIEIVLELASDNVLDEKQAIEDELLEHRAEQIEAIKSVEAQFESLGELVSSAQAVWGDLQSERMQSNLSEDDEGMEELCKDHDQLREVLRMFKELTK